MTPRAWGLLALGGGLVALWSWVRWPELLGLGAALLLLVALSLLFRAPRSASWTDISAPARVERGAPAEVIIGIDVVGSERWVSVRDPDGTQSRWVGAAHSASGSGRSRLTWPVDTSRRGSFLVGPATLEFGDPFGLRNRILATRALSPVLVVPRVTPVPSVDLMASATEGALLERAGIEQFHSVREYATGDPRKLVHWKASARTGTLMVRRLVDTTTPTLLVVLETAPSRYEATRSAFHDYSPELFESAVDLAASYAWQHATSAHHVLITTTATGAPVIDVTARTRDSALDWLALVAASPDPATPARIEQVIRRRPVGAVVLVTGPHAPTDSIERAWRRWAPVTVVRAA